ncbi:MAG: hypothetical protein IPG55_06695 [Saprospiraceae bacterium]|nr:hypothetical protein [Candidatus Defluviibacterium haderslevense]
MKEEIRTKDQSKEDNNHLVISYIALRNLIGFSGMLLPIVLVLFNDCNLLCSISHYYYSEAGDILVGFMVLIGTFLFTYNGYGGIWEKLCYVFAGLGALCAGLCPPSHELVCIDSLEQIHTTINLKLLGNFHLPGAAIFLSLSAFITLYYFTKRDQITPIVKDKSWRNKNKRNIVYYICGTIMVLSLIILAVYLKISKNINFPQFYSFVFIFETIAVWAFGIAWLTKGQTFFNDGEHYIKTGVKELMKRI